jgi:hypothetical protein
MVSKKHGNWISESTSLGNRTKGVREFYRVKLGQSMIVTGTIEGENAEDITPSYVCKCKRKTGDEEEPCPQK